MLQAEVVGVQSRNEPTKGLQRLKTKGGIEDSTMIHFVTISSPASKWELRGLQFHFIKWLKMSFKLKSHGILKLVKISLPNSNHKVFLPKKSNYEMVVGLASLPP